MGGRHINKTILTEADFLRLSALARAAKKGSRSELAKALDERLRDALLFEEGTISPNYVKMQSLVTMRDENSGESFTYRLVFPGEADISLGCVSILSPLGAALLGRHEGESFSYTSPGGSSSVKIEHVTHET